MAANANVLVSPAQYLKAERSAEIKSEYHDGQIFAMSGGSLAHSVIPAALIAALIAALRDRDCTVVTTDLRVQIGRQSSFVYPDVTVFCGEPQLADEHNDTLQNPTVVVEVLSKSTEGYDRGYKFGKYRRIESLRDYVLVSQTEPKIEVFSTTDSGQWLFTEFAGTDDICVLPGIGCNIALADVYRRVRFPQDQTQASA